MDCIDILVRRRRAITLGLVAVYLLGFALCRATGVLVHRELVVLPHQVGGRWYPESGLHILGPARSGRLVFGIWKCYYPCLWAEGRLRAALDRHVIAEAVQ